MRAMTSRQLGGARFALAALLALALTPSCGGGGDPTARFVGPWTFSAGTVVPMCTLVPVSSFSIAGLNVTFEKVDSSTIKLTVNAGCVVSFKVSGSKATVVDGQTCSLDVPQVGTVSISVTSWTLTLVGDHIDTSLSGMALGICTAMGTGTLVHGTTDAGAPMGGHGGSTTTGTAGGGGGGGAGGAAGATGGGGTGGAAGATGSAGAGGGTGAGGQAGGVPDGGAGEAGGSDASDAPAAAEAGSVDAPSGDSD